MPIDRLLASFTTQKSSEVFVLPDENSPQQSKSAENRLPRKVTGVVGLLPPPGLEG